MRCARQMNIPCRSVAAKASQLLEADEAGVTKALGGVRPLTVVEGRKIHQEKVGPITKMLSDRYRINVHLSCPA